MTTQDTADTIATYDAEAGEFAQFQWTTANFESMLVKFLGTVARRDLPIVDAGCGAGRDTAAIAARGFSVIGVDLSAGLLKEAAARCRDERVRWLQSDLTSMPSIASGTVAGVWINSTLLHFDEAGRSAVFAEFRRILAPGAPLFLTTVAGAGRYERRTKAGRVRWSFGANLDQVTRVLEGFGFAIQSATLDRGVVRSDEWINVLAISPSK